jgi:hypothetical protein
MLAGLPHWRRWPPYPPTHPEHSLKCLPAVSPPDALLPHLYTSTCRLFQMQAVLSHGLLPAHRSAVSSQLPHLWALPH